MEPGIYIESKPAAFGQFHNRRHLYLVYRDGEGREEVVRGGPSKEDTPVDFLFGGKIEIEAGIPLQESKDAYGPDDSPEKRRATRLDLDGRDPVQVWRTITAASEKLRDAKIDYNLSILDDMQNSNSVARHVMEAAALDPGKHFPKTWDPDLHSGFENDLNAPQDDHVFGIGQTKHFIEKPGDPPSDGPDDGLRGWTKPGALDLVAARENGKMRADRGGGRLPDGAWHEKQHLLPPRSQSQVGLPTSELAAQLNSARPRAGCQNTARRRSEAGMPSTDLWPPHSQGHRVSQKLAIASATMPRRNTASTALRTCGC